MKNAFFNILCLCAVKSARSLENYNESLKLKALMESYVVPNDVDESVSVEHIEREQHHRSLQNGPKIAWIMSYPESGVTYLLKLVHDISGRATATNYGTHKMDANGKISKVLDNSTPVFTDGSPSPHYNIGLPAPDSYALTRTHSYGSCFDCPPWKYLGATANLRHMKINTYGSRVKNGVTQTFKYGIASVEKLVVLYRDPLDHIVARFYQKHDSETISGNSQFGEAFPLTPEGFHDWCAFQDSPNHPYHIKENNWYEVGGYLAATEGVPCRAEFVKLFHFYDYVRKVGVKYNLGMFEIGLQEVAADMEGAMGSLLDFVEYPIVNSPPQNLLGEGKGLFHNHYTEEQKAAVAKLGKQLSSPRVWDYGFKPLLEEFL